MYAGNAVIPQAVLVTSLMQQKLGCLTVAYVREANKMLKELLTLHHARIRYMTPMGMEDAHVLTLSDAAHRGKGCENGQTGGLSGILDKRKNGTKVYHLLDWTSHKQRRISYSSFGAEIVACADNDDRGYDIKEPLIGGFPTRRTKSKLIVGSRALYETITKPHDNREYWLRKTVACVRNSIE